MVSSTGGSLGTAFTYFSTTTERSTLQEDSPTYLTTEQWRSSAYYTRGSTTHYSPTSPSESTYTNSILIIITLTIVLSLGSIFGFIYCLMKADNKKLRLDPLEPTHPQGTSPSTSVTVCDELPDYDAVMTEPTAAPQVSPPQLIIRSLTQEDDSPPPGYVTPVVMSDSNKGIPFTLPPPPTYEEAISSQPNSRANSFTEFPHLSLNPE